MRRRCAASFLLLSPVARSDALALAISVLPLHVALTSHPLTRTHKAADSSNSFSPGSSSQVTSLLASRTSLRRQHLCRPSMKAPVDDEAVALSDQPSCLPQAVFAADMDAETKRILAICDKLSPENRAEMLKICER